MRPLIVLLSALLLTPLISHAQATEANPQTRTQSTQAEPAGEGAYWRAPDGWRQMVRVLSVGKGHEYVLLPFVVQPRTLRFPGAEAPVKISQPRPVFLLKGSPVPGGGSTRDVVLVRLDKKKNRRELPITPGKTIFHSTLESLPKDHTPEILINAQSPALFTVIPKNDLPPGEYMLTFGIGQVGGFDFEVIASVPAKTLTTANRR